MATPTSDLSSASVVQIASNGNIILIVGPDKRRFQVSSSVLQNASQYFRNMFGPHFSEGQDLGAESRKEISMLEDDANALEIICNIIHLRNDVVPEVLNPVQVLGIVAAADKFDCVVAVKHASVLWLNPLDIRDITELGYLMGAAYIVDNVRAFSEITHALIFRAEERFIVLAKEDIGLDNSVLWHIIYLLEERKNFLNTRLQDIILDGVSYVKSDNDDEDEKCDCNWVLRHRSAYMTLLHDEGFWPSQTSNYTMSYFLEEVEHMDDPFVEVVECDQYYRHVAPNYRSTRGKMLAEYKKSNGLCLDCVRSSVTGTENACRIEHN